MNPHRTTLRARRAFWFLTGIAVVSLAALTRALAAQPGPFTGLLVAGSGVLLIVSLTLASRVMLALDHARRGRASGAAAGGSTAAPEMRSRDGRRDRWFGEPEAPPVRRGNGRHSPRPTTPVCQVIAGARTQVTAKGSVPRDP